MLRVDIFVPEEVIMRISRSRIILLLGAVMSSTMTIPIFELQLEREATRMRSCGIKLPKRLHSVPKAFQNRLLSLGNKRRHSGHRESNARMSTRGKRGGRR